MTKQAGTSKRSEAAADDFSNVRVREDRVVALNASGRTVENEDSRYGISGFMTTTLLWLNDIACKDMPLDAFFIEAGHSIDPETLNTCRSCPVRLECLAHGYDYGSGYRGGLSPGQRRAMDLPEAIEYAKADKPRPSRKKRS